MNDLVAYKILTSLEWEEFQRDQIFHGSQVDVADGYIHLSTAEQLEETLQKHYSGQSNLTIATVDLTVLGNNVRWEASRGGQLFPHIYGPLPIQAVTADISR